MKNWLKLCLLFVSIILYVVGINIFANLISISSENYEISKTTILGGTAVEINVGTSVSVSVTRAPHWYGRFNEQNGKKYLNLFYFCNIPWKIKTYNFVWFHIIFLITIILFSILIFIKKNYKGGEHEKNEKLGEDFDNLGDFSTSISD